MTPDRPFSRLRWALARVVAIIEENGYGTDQVLAAELGLTRGELRTVIGALYRQRRVDRAAGYLCLPANREDTTA